MENIFVLHDSFEDYLGNNHQFTVAAVLDKAPEDLIVAEVGTDFITPVIATLTLGIAVCNTKDTWDSKKGELIAVGRAHKYGDHMLTINSRAMLNVLTDDAINELLEKEAGYIKEHIGLYIPGYDEMKRRHENALKEAEVRKNLSDSEKQVLAIVENDGVSNECKELLKKSL